MVLTRFLRHCVPLAALAATVSWITTGAIADDAQKPGEPADVLIANDDAVFNFDSVQVAPHAVLIVADGDAKEESKPTSYWIGVECQAIDGAMRTQLNLEKDHGGLLVLNVIKDGPAEKAGIKQHDILFRATVPGPDMDLHEVSDLVKAVETAKDTQMSLMIMRGGKPLTVPIKAAPRPENRPAKADVLRKFPGVDPQLMKWLEKAPGQGHFEFKAPLELHSVGPGMVLPDGAAGHFTYHRPSQLPDDMTVTVVREGKKPAKITVKQGENTWEATEGELDKLPEKVRAQVQPMLGGIGPLMRGAIQVKPFKPTKEYPIDKPEKGAKQSEPSNATGYTPPNVTGASPQAARLNPQDANRQIERRLDELGRRLDELRDTIRDLRESRRPDAPAEKPRPRETSKGGA